MSAHRPVGHNAPVVALSLIRRLVPVPVRARLRRWRAGSPDPRGLRVAYRALPGLPIGGYDATGNTHGTHLNESGDIRELDEYIRTFDPELEQNLAGVRDTLGLLHRQVAPLVSPEASLLDVGCGIGRFASLLRRPGSPSARWQYTGVERTDAIVTACRRLHPGDLFLSTGGSPTIPVPDRSADVVLASSMLQYTGDAWLTALADMARVTRQLIAVTRLPLLEQTPSTHCEQTVRYAGREETHWLLFLSRRDFEAGVASLGLRILASEPGTEAMPTTGLRENVSTHAYLLGPREMD